MPPEARLAHHYASVEKIILRRQDAVTGLLPASTAVNAHGDYTDAWVRDNVYSILAAMKRSTRSAWRIIAASRPRISLTVLCDSV